MSEDTPLYDTSGAHYNVTGGHIQDVSPNWPGGVAAFGNGSYHEVFQVQMAAEIKRNNPAQHTIFRSYLAHQQPLLFAENKRDAADDWIQTWCDDTFISLAHSVDFATDLNEYFSNSDSHHDREHKILWASAFADVWNNKWRNRPELRHIRAVLARTAVGNDIPVETAQDAMTYDCGLAYHCYWPVRDGDTLPDSARWYHQRWQEMDKQYKSAGITVPFWVSTEIGAVGYSQSDNGDIHLHPDDGWKHPRVYNGSMDAFIASLKRWAQEVANWNAFNDNRFLGGQIFTTNLPHNGWTHFSVTGDELKVIGDAMSAWRPLPPPMDELTRLFNQAEASQCIEQTPEAALQKAIRQDGRLLLGNEYQFWDDFGRQWVCRYAGNGNPSPKWVYMFPVGDYRPESLRIEENTMNN